MRNPSDNLAAIALIAAPLVVLGSQSFSTYANAAAPVTQASAPETSFSQFMADLVHSLCAPPLHDTPQQSPRDNSCQP